MSAYGNDMNAYGIVATKKNHGSCAFMAMTTCANLKKSNQEALWSTEAKSCLRPHRCKRSVSDIGVPTSSLSSQLTEPTLVDHRTWLNPDTLQAAALACTFLLACCVVSAARPIKPAKLQCSSEDPSSSTRLMGICFCVCMHACMPACMYVCMYDVCAGIDILHTSTYVYICMCMQCLYTYI